MDYKLTSSFTLTPEVNYKASYFADDLNAIKIDSVTILNLLATYKTKISNYDLTLFARIDNVFDKFYYNTARASSDRDKDKNLTKKTYLLL
jgi:iron complex outermembrane recepter protein